ncbi:MAG: glycosyltransferase family 2 protein [Actinomycetota bacterium]
MSDRRALAIVPAHDEERTVGATVRALGSVPGIDTVVVVDDGSTDATADRAVAAGAVVLRSPRRLGKGRAMEAALSRCSAAQVYVFADADLAETASALAPVVAAVLERTADLCIAVLPPQGGGFGSVKRFARWAIEATSGFRAREPLSGQRAITAELLASCRPLAGGFGVEAAMTIDAVRAGGKVLELEAPLRHRSLGRTLGGFVHRGRQGWDILLAVVGRGLR